MIRRALISAAWRVHDWREEMGNWPLWAKRVTALIFGFAAAFASYPWLN